MNRKLRIIVFINTSWNIFNFRKGLISALLHDGHEVIALAPADESVEKLEALGCRCVDIPMENHGSNPISDWFLMIRIRKLFMQLEPDVVLQYTIKPNIYGTLAARKLGIPVINNVSGLGTVFIRKNFVSKIALKLYQYAFKFPAKVFFQNRDDKELFVKSGLIKEEITGLVPGSGINTSEYQQVPFQRKKRFTFMLIARLLYDKGVLEYVEAAREVKRNNPDVDFVVYGFIDESANLGVPASDIETWHKEGIIDFRGSTDNPMQVIATADCVVLPSYREGTPKSLLEAAALGKPIVTTDVPGCREVVKDGYNGLLCEVKSACDLAEKMLGILQKGDEELTTMGNNSRDYCVSKFDESIVIERYQKEIKRVTNGS